MIVRLFDFLLKHLLCLVDLGGQVWRTSAIGVVEQHERAVLFAQKVFCDAALTINGQHNVLSP